MKFDVVAGAEGHYHRLFKVRFRRDGSIFVIFPGFVSTSGILCRATMPAGGTGTKQLSLKENGKVTNHLVKFTHHPDGQAHFSQQGKIKTEIQRMSVSLAEQRGHLFTVQVQALNSFPRRESPRKDQLTLNIEGDMRSLKIVGWRWPVSSLRTTENPSPTKKIGGMLLGDGPKGGLFVCPPDGYRFDDYFLFLSFEEIPWLSEDKTPHLIFIGGFDEGEIAYDHSRDSEFLALSYPCSDPESLANSIGTVDFIPK